jgi:hypothetical protein
MSDPILPSDAVALAPEVACDDAVAMAPAAVPMSFIANESQVSPSASVLPDLATTTGNAQPTLGNKVADVLLMYDSMLYYDPNTDDKREVQLRRVMDLYAQYFLGGAALEGFTGFNDFVARLQAYQTIRELVMFIHGQAGQLIVTVKKGNTLEIENKDLKQIADMFQGVAPQVTYHVNFESCVVADNPSQMILFKNLFQTPRITGWNYFHIISRWTLPLIGNVSADQIRGVLQYPDDYLMPGMPHPTTYAGQSGTFEFLYEWFRLDENATPPGLDPDRRVFVPRGNATTIALFSQQASCMPALKNPEEVKDLVTLCDPTSDEGRFWDLAHVTIRN